MAKFIANLRAHPSCELKFNVYMQPFGLPATFGFTPPDVRRQDGREWIRLDDTVIRRIRSEDVAEGGSEEDPKILAAALEHHKTNHGVNGNYYNQVALDSEENTQSEFSQDQEEYECGGSYMLENMLST